MMSAAPCSADAECMLSIEMSGEVTLEATGIMTCSEGACAASRWIHDGGSQAIVGYAVIQNYYTGTRFDRPMGLPPPPRREGCCNVTLRLYLGGFWLQRTL